MSAASCAAHYRCRACLIRDKYLINWRLFANYPPFCIFFITLTRLLKLAAGAPLRLHDFNIQCAYKQLQERTLHRLQPRQLSPPLRLRERGPLRESLGTNAGKFNRGVIGIFYYSILVGSCFMWSGTFDSSIKFLNTTGIAHD